MNRRHFSVVNTAVVMRAFSLAIKLNVKLPPSEAEPGEDAPFLMMLTLLVFLLGY